MRIDFKIAIKMVTTHNLGNDSIAFVFLRVQFEFSSKIKLNKFNLVSGFPKYCFCFMDRNAINWSIRAGGGDGNRLTAATEKMAELSEREPTKPRLLTAEVPGIKDNFGKDEWARGEEAPAPLFGALINLQQGLWLNNVDTRQWHIPCSLLCCFHSFIRTALVMSCVCLSVVFGCLGASGHDSSVWVIKHTHAAISTTPSQNRPEALKGCWTESQLQLACAVTVYTITPFKICQLQYTACQNPSDCCLVVSTFPNNILYLYLSTSYLQ